MLIAPFLFCQMALQIQPIKPGQFLTGILGVTPFSIQGFLVLTATTKQTTFTHLKLALFSFNHPLYQPSKHSQEIVFIKKSLFKGNDSISLEYAHSHSHSFIFNIQDSNRWHHGFRYHILKATYKSSQGSGTISSQPIMINPLGVALLPALLLKTDLFLNKHYPVNMFDPGSRLVLKNHKIDAECIVNKSILSQGESITIKIKAIQLKSTIKSINFKFIESKRYKSKSDSISSIETHLNTKYLNDFTATEIINVKLNQQLDKYLDHCEFVFSVSNISTSGTFGLLGDPSLFIRHYYEFRIDFFDASFEVVTCKCLATVFRLSDIVELVGNYPTDILNKLPSELTNFLRIEDDGLVIGEYIQANDDYRRPPPAEVIYEAETVEDCGLEPYYDKQENVRNSMSKFMVLGDSFGLNQVDVCEPLLPLVASGCKSNNGTF